MMKTPTFPPDGLKIGITDCARYNNYEQWILNFSPEHVKVIKLSYTLDNVDDLEQCHGVVLSGGEDVSPRLYKQADIIGKVELTDIDDKRDEFEIKIIDKALKLNLPILGICRGMQLFNVYHGGTLIYDIPTVTQINGHAKIQGIDQRHEIHVEEKSLLNEITGCLKGTVNSSHHQCVGQLAAQLRAIATAESPIVECTQWAESANHSFFLGVQWHPERMPDQENPFSSNIRQAFLEYTLSQQGKENRNGESTTTAKDIEQQEKPSTNHTSSAPRIAAS